MNFRSFFLAIIALLGALCVNAQHFRLTKENTCFFYGTCETNVVEMDSKPASPETVRFLKQIFSTISLSPRINAYEGELPGEIAAAMISLSDRYIMVDEKNIKQIRNNVSSNWPSVFIIAHECAHHLNSIPTDSLESSIDAELAADFFAGYVLHKFGASRSQMLTALNALKESDCSDHPPKEQRIDIAVKGWQKAENEKTSASPTPPRTNVYEELNLELTPDFKIKVVDNPVDFNPRWDLVDRYIPVNFSVENHVASRPITTNQKWNIQMPPYNDEMVIWFPPFVTCECIATLELPSKTIITDRPQTFRLVNFRKFANNTDGGPCMGLSNMYFAGGWSGDITLSVNKKGDLFMDLEFRAYRSGGGISYRYTAKGIQSKVDFVPSRK